MGSSSSTSARGGSAQPPVVAVGRSKSCKGRCIASAMVDQSHAASPQEGLDAAKQATSADDDATLVLPDECLALIFDRLDARGRNSAALVCRRWLRIEGHSRRLLALSAPADLGRCLRRLLLRFSGITKLGLKCPRGVASVTDDALLLVATLCPMLHKLKLKGCTGLTDAGLEAFAVAASSSFRSLSCCSCGFGARGLNAVLRHCSSSLEGLSVKKLRFADPNEFVLGPAATTRGGSSKLRRLSIKCVVDGGHVFAPLIAGSRHLQELHLFKVAGQWDRLLELVMDGGLLQELIELRLEKIQLGDRGLNAVARCRKLQVLFLAKAPECTNSGIAAIAQGCRSLRKLHIDGCFSGRIGDKGLISVAEKCPELKELVLIGLNATAESLNLLGSNCTGLERLALWNSETFGDRELYCIAAKCRALKKLCIKCCPISDKGLEALASGCPSLSKVKIKKCRGVSLAGTSSLQMAHDGLVISLESDPVVVVVDPAAAAAEDGGVAGTVVQRARGPSSSSASRSAFSRARMALVAALGRVLS